MKNLFSDVVIFTGIAVVGHGVWRLSPVAGEFYIGAALCVLGWLVHRR